jgi:hypothetical protein
VISLGKFRTVNMGDFTYNREKELMCPNNPVGTVDLFLTPHHGIDQSGSPALVHGLHPRVAVMHNSTRKGGAIPTMQTLYSSPGLEDIWQLHWAYAAGVDYNTPALFIANPEELPTLANVLLNPPPTFGQGPAPGRGAPPPPAGGAPGAPGAPGPGVAKAPPGAAPPPGAVPPAGGRGFGAGGHDGPAFLIKASALADGSFTVTNTRNNFSKTYPAAK